MNAADCEYAELLQYLAGSLDEGVVAGFLVNVESSGGTTAHDNHRVKLNHAADEFAGPLREPRLDLLRALFLQGLSLAKLAV